MAGGSRKEPGWLGPTTSLVDSLTKEFNLNLKTIAKRLARHEKAESILIRHVNEAFSVTV